MIENNMSNLNREEYDAFRKDAERYIQYPRQATDAAVRRWRNRVVKWLREHLPDSGLADELLGITIQGRSNRESPIQRSLKI